MGDQKGHYIKKYFAAANTYRGFVSFFDKVFSSKEYNRIYVLKGGPGTGKSSFMKKICENFISEDCETEQILCSSDPHSLDGVILKKNGKSVALIDGTAPHERDAIIPGCIDEIINLGEGWDSRILTAQREKILSITEEKASSYKTAYNYLKIAGQINDFILNVYIENFNKSKAKKEAESILSSIASGKHGKISIRLISSFGRYGAYNLDTICEMDSNIISIGGSKTAAELLLNCCFEVLNDKCVDFLHLPCSLDPNNTDAIYLPYHRIALTCGDGDINADSFLEITATDKERIRYATKIKETLLEEAKRWFGIASDLHFRLEEIYGNAMNFSINDDILSHKIREIRIILENEG